VNDDHHHYHNQERRLFMDNDRPFDVSPYIAELLDAGIPMLVYNGDRDMTTNMVGQELILNEMDWKGKKGWLDAPRGLWNVNDYPAGWSKEYEGLTFIVIYNSGHMVPYNQPGPASDLVTRFLTKKSFIDMELPQIRIKTQTHRTSFSDRISKVEIASITEQPTFSSKAEISGFGALFSVAKQHETALVAIFSMFAGFIVAVLVMRRGGGRGHNAAGYQRVPDATM
jgi:Serine carboxypeptidase